ncbi:unnamed protein product [Rotaria magnacalcarata]|uniref:Phosphorylase b kinase regulatory subunit n=1 Tax=Rotaria magnacalcarata TaxID=392030 RepID=A0A816WR26_9BILA|nr:unnamed protein product [Rotaria magnacalcarata]
MASLNIAGVPTLPSNTSGFNRSRRSSWSDSKNVWNVGDEAENYSDSHTLILKKLDIHYHKVKRQILAFQSLTTGLFPTHLDTDKKVAHVVENIFCSIAVWSLRQCYCKIDNDQGRAHELGQAAVKCMRGILNCWMKQAKKLKYLKVNNHQWMPYIQNSMFSMVVKSKEQMNALNTISPNEIKQLLYYVLTTNLQQSTLQGGDIEQRSSFQKRQMDGALSRVPTNFYEHVWSILERAPKGIQLCSILLPQQPTLSDMTDYELNFSLKIEEMLGRLLDPVYRCLVVEMFESINVLLQRNPELCFVQPLDVDYLISDAVKLFEQQTKSLDSLKDFYNLPISLVGGSTGYMIQVPYGMPEFRQAVLACYHEIETLALELTKVFFVGSENDFNQFSSHFQWPSIGLRMLHYLPQPSPVLDDAFGSAPHCDHGFITILSHDDVDA